ncbi:MAG: PRC-barrel domain-containing protein [Marinobacter sp.]
MKILHSLAFYALVTPAIAFSSSAVFAEQSTDQEADMENQGIQSDQDAMKSNTKTEQDEKGMAQSEKKMGDQPDMQNKGYMDAAPADSMHASNLIDAKIKTTGDEDVGPVSDLIIDQDGQIVAVVVGVGGFLGMGEKDVAIAWDDVTKTGSADEQELRIDATREELKSAPEFVTEK